MSSQVIKPTWGSVRRLMNSLRRLAGLTEARTQGWWTYFGSFGDDFFSEQD